MAGAAPTQVIPSDIARSNAFTEDLGIYVSFVKLLSKNFGNFDLHLTT